MSADVWAPLRTARKHGTVSCYRAGCRRPECRAAVAEAERERQARKPRRVSGKDADHGALSRARYGQGGSAGKSRPVCRCEPCCEVRSADAGLGVRGDRLLVDCWCGTDRVLVLQTEVMAIRTGSCGRCGCEGPQ